MLNMQTFYKLLSPPFKGTDAYFKSLHLLTRSSRMQMSALESDLSWQEWGEQNKKS